MSSLAQRLVDITTRISTECKSIRTLINGNAVDLSSLKTTSRANLVVALNELKDDLVHLEEIGAATIDDSLAQSLDHTYSITKIRDLVSTAISGLLGNAPAALDTLKELADAIGNDSNFAASITAGLALRVRVDVANQGLTLDQKQNARTNIDAIGRSEIGDPDTNFVAIFNAGLA